MQHALKLFHTLSIPVANHGFIYLIAFIVPVYWKQDFKFKNNGYDILSLWNSKGSYCHGTVGDRGTFFRCHN